MFEIQMKMTNNWTSESVMHIDVYRDIVVFRIKMVYVMKLYSQQETI